MCVSERRRKRYRSLTTAHLSLMALLQERFKLENFHPSFEQISKFKSKKENSLHLQKSRFLKIQTLSAEAPAATRCMSAWLACLESGKTDYVHPTTAMASLSARKTWQEMYLDSYRPHRMKQACLLTYSKTLFSPVVLKAGAKLGKFTIWHF